VQNDLEDGVSIQGQTKNDLESSAVTLSSLALAN
jgi:hypothetical protein